MGLEIRHSEKALRIAGALTLERAAKLKAELLRWTRGASQLVFDFEAVTEVDLPCLQIICSTCITAEGLGKRFILNGTCPDAFKRTVENAGYECLKLQDENKV